MIVHIVRVDGINHAVISTRKNLKIRPGTRTVCAVQLDRVDYQYRPGGYPHTVITCDGDVRAVNALADILD